MGVNSTLEDLMRVIKIFHDLLYWILSFDNLFLAFWKALACPLHGECSLTLLVSQFRESEILIKVGCQRGHPELSFGASWSVFTEYRRLLLFMTHLSSHSLNPHFNISIFIYVNTLV